MHTPQASEEPCYSHTRGEGVNHCRSHCPLAKLRVVMTKEGEIQRCDWLRLAGGGQPLSFTLSSG